jgi:hypothetical protein
MRDVAFSPMEFSIEKNRFWAARLWHSTALRLGVLAFIVFNINLRSETSMDTYATRYIPVGIVTHLTLTLDRFPSLHTYPSWWHDTKDKIPYYIQIRRGHFVSTYPVMPAILSAPIYALPVWAAALLGVPMTLAVVTVLAKLAASFACAVSVSLVYLTLRRLTAPRPALWIALIYAFATSTWSVSSQGLWQTAWSQPLLAAAFYFLVRAREEQGRFLIWAGLMLALSVACRSPNIVFAALLTIYVLHEHWWGGRGGEGADFEVEDASGSGVVRPNPEPRTLKPLLSFLIFPILIGAGLAAYRLYYFASLAGGYAHEMSRLEHSEVTKFAFSYPHWTAFWGLLISPSRGILVLSPVLIFSVIAMGIVLWRRRDRMMVYISIASIALVIFYSAWSVWDGAYCYSYRFLVDLLPGLCLLLAVVWDWLMARPWRKALLGATVAFSLFVQVVGAFFYPSDWYSKPINPSLQPSRFWDWSDMELVRCLKDGPKLPDISRALSAR